MSLQEQFQSLAEEFHSLAILPIPNEEAAQRRLKALHTRAGRVFAEAVRSEFFENPFGLPLPDTEATDWQYESYWVNILFFIASNHAELPTNVMAVQWENEHTGSTHHEDWRTRAGNESAVCRWIARLEAEDTNGKKKTRRRRLTDPMLLERNKWIYEKKTELGWTHAKTRTELNKIAKKKNWEELHSDQGVTNALQWFENWLKAQSN